MPCSMMAFRQCAFRDVTGEVTSQALSLQAKSELSLAILSLFPLNYMLSLVTKKSKKSITILTPIPTYNT